MLMTQFGGYNYSRELRSQGCQFGSQSIISQHIGAFKDESISYNCLSQNDLGISVKFTGTPFALQNPSVL